MKKLFFSIVAALTLLSCSQQPAETQDVNPDQVMDEVIMSSARMMTTSESAAPYLQRLNFSEGYHLLYCIGLGYPDEAPAAKPRKEEKVMYIE